jgi:hypothetical protein
MAPIVPMALSLFASKTTGMQAVSKIFFPRESPEEHAGEIIF